MAQDNGQCVMIAGASGLVGQQLLTLLLQQPGIHKIFCLARRPLPTIPEGSGKVVSLLDQELAIHEWDEDQPTPAAGFICLGTTLKQAGSKQNLRKIDVDLVCKVAQQMRFIGVRRIAVISSLGADKNSPFHYLACKGQMEHAIANMGFEEVVVVRPGPLVGERAEPRNDEKWLQRLLRFLRPVMIGRLANYIPISALDVAKAMLYQVFSYQQEPVVYLTRKEMLDLIRHYE
ncbi:NAD(P)H-binding protein [Vibrio sp. CAU 1672]|uniref:NAD(P)H-binding protein n=1 Tax=Vibrio sp. CAU 1672 TaxID=3032594 RepID=UPI0023DB2907|nr:NAD(P)H-binding protein [Vibrio sp. CAU 1672]MDF2152330.1 NAD(P)H-binding protein [Vibrio sp. CAU 1672]